MSDQDDFSFTNTQWNFLTNILGWILPERFAPARADEDDDEFFDAREEFEDDDGADEEFHDARDGTEDEAGGHGETPPGDDPDDPDDAGEDGAKDEEATKSAARVKAVADLADDSTALPDLAAAFDEGASDPAFIKSATEKLAAVSKSLTDVGRSQDASGLDDDDWNAHVNAVRATAPDTRALRIKIKDMLADPDDLDPDLVSELETMQAAIEDTLMEILDLEPAHGPTNHVKLTQDGAGKRALLGTNPRTGAANDKAANATKFKTPGAFLDALEAGRASPELVAAIAEVTDDSDPDHPVLTDDYVKISLKLEDVLGEDYLDLVEGQTVVGTGGNRKDLKTALKNGDDAAADALLGAGGMGVAATDLTDGTIEFGFIYLNGTWELSTIHPDVARDANKTPVIPRPSTPELRYDRANDQWLKQDPSDGDQWKPYNPETDEWE